MSELGTQTATLSREAALTRSFSECAGEESEKIIAAAEPTGIGILDEARETRRAGVLLADAWNLYARLRSLDAVQRRA